MGNVIVGQHFYLSPNICIVFILVACPCFVFVSWSFVLCFVDPSLEIFVTSWSVNFALFFLSHKNGDFSILMRDIVSQYLFLIMGGSGSLLLIEFPFSVICLGRGRMECVLYSGIHQ
jgi:hypothetical protein